MHENGEKPVFTRIAGVGDTIYVDLCNPEYEVVRITGAGWEVVKEPTVSFIRGTGMESLPRPERTGKGFDDLEKLMNCKEDEDFCILTSFLVGCFSFGNPYPILCLQGPLNWKIIENSDDKETYRSESGRSSW